ncbi:hypothetical protein BN903_69 [Halorubrum sp. AJ67]|nr:hypothetical protein BN903_69 [Halorubrum sp. AJ67]
MGTLSNDRYSVEGAGNVVRKVVTTHELGPSRSPNPRFRGTSRPCEPAKSGA